MVIVMAKDLRHSQQLLAEAAVMTYVFYVSLVTTVTKTVSVVTVMMSLHRITCI